MKVGQRTLSIAVPDDLDDRLMSLAGVSAKEMRAMLDGYCQSSIMAAALLPFVKDPPSRQELAETIAKAGADKVRLDVRELYDRALKKASGDAKK